MSEAPVCIITGASSGIGRACAWAFARKGFTLILCARREDRLNEVQKELHSEGFDRVLPVVLDIRDRAAVEKCVTQLGVSYRSIDVLVNNAGVSRGLEPIHQSSVDDWEEMIDTNIKGLLYVTRAILPGMVERGRGDVISIGSISNRDVYPGGHVYCGTKFAVDAITKGMRLDLLGTGVRVSSVDPGLLATEFSLGRFHGDQARADQVYKGIENQLTPEDVAEAVVWVASRPRAIQVAELLIMSADQGSGIHVHRQKD